MTKLFFPLFILCLFFGGYAGAQELQNPVIKNYGGIYAIPDATVVPDDRLTYQIIVDVYTGSKDSTEVGFGLNNVARMLNLHAVGGVPPGKMEVVLAIHGGATAGIVDNATYREMYGVDNPNAGLVKELKEAGVKLVVCGQSLLSRGFASDALLPEIELGTSMLTTVSMYQLRGFALFKF